MRSVRTVVMLLFIALFLIPAGGYGKEGSMGIAEVNSTITPQISQYLVPQSLDNLSTPLPAERKKGDNKASENGWYMLILEVAVAGISNLVSTEKNRDCCWARYPGKYFDQCLSADGWRTGKNADR